MEKLITTPKTVKKVLAEDRKELVLPASPAEDLQKTNPNFEEIFDLYGNDLKKNIRHLRQFKRNTEMFSVSIKVPNYLWISKKQDSEISTCINAFSEFLYAEKIIAFRGIAKYFEYKLAYVSPNSFFSELTLLNNVVARNAGYHRYFQGVAAIDISAWMRYSNQAHFQEFLHYVSSKNDEILFVLCINSDNETDVKEMESSLSDCIYVAPIQIEFPNADLSLEFLDRELKRLDFSLTDTAKDLLKNSVQEIVGSQNFRGVETLKKLAIEISSDVSQKVDFTSTIRAGGSKKIISDGMLNDFKSDSKYVRRLQRLTGRQSIGFINTSK